MRVLLRAARSPRSRARGREGPGTVLGAGGSAASSRGFRRGKKARKSRCNRSLREGKCRGWCPGEPRGCQPGRSGASGAAARALLRGQPRARTRDQRNSLEIRKISPFCLPPHHLFFHNSGCAWCGVTPRSPADGLPARSHRRETPAALSTLGSVGGRNVGYSSFEQNLKKLRCGGKKRGCSSLCRLAINSHRAWMFPCREAAGHRGFWEPSPAGSPWVALSGGDSS